MVAHTFILFARLVIQTPTLSLPSARSTRDLAGLRPSRAPLPTRVAVQRSDVNGAPRPREAYSLQVPRFVADASRRASDIPPASM